MIDLVDGALVLALLAALVTALVSVARSIGPLLRIVRIASSRVADLRPGTVEVAGTARARGEPLPGLGGEPLVASRRVMHFTYHEGDETYASKPVEDTAYVAFNVVDESGACAVEVERATVIGPARDWVFGVKAFAERQPALYDLLGCEGHADVLQIMVEETMIADGGVVLVSGAAKPDGTTAPAEGYRGARERLRIAAPEGGTLILSGWNEASTRRRFARPVILAAWMALLSLVTAGLVIRAPALIASIAGL